MNQVFYEVRGVKDPIDGNVVKFEFKKDALDYYEEIKAKYPEASVYGIECVYNGVDGYDANEFPIAGKDWDDALKNNPRYNSCEFDNSDNYVDGNFRPLNVSDDIDDDLSDVTL